MNDDTPENLLIFAILMICFGLAVGYMSDSLNKDVIIKEQKTDTMFNKWRRIY